MLVTLCWGDLGSLLGSWSTMVIWTSSPFWRIGKRTPLPLEALPKSAKANHKRTLSNLTYFLCIVNCYLRLLIISLRPKEWILTTIHELEGSPPSHPFAIYLLKYFSHAFPNEKTVDLSPKKSIELHNNCNPKTILLNKPTNRMNPKEIMKIQW